MRSAMPPRLIALGDADVMVAGGTEAPICRLGMAGFCAARALSTGYNETPNGPRGPMTRTATASSWARAPASWCSRNTSTRKSRGAKIYAEVVGYGLSGDAYPHHLADAGRRWRLPLHERGDQARRHRGPISTTSTRTAPRRRSATRSNSARSSGCSATPPPRCRCRRRNRRSATCSVPPARSRPFSVSLRSANNVAPPTINLENPSVETAIDLVPQTARKREINVALSNSFGSAGTNASVIVRRVAD